MACAGVVVRNGHMLKVEPTESADGLDVGSEGKREEPRVTHRFVA